jgi:hypothetical protein
LKLLFEEKDYKLLIERGKFDIFEFLYQFLNKYKLYWDYSKKYVLF